MKLETNKNVYDQIRYYEQLLMHTNIILNKLLSQV